MFRFFGAAVTVLTLALPSQGLAQKPAEPEVLGVIDADLASVWAEHQVRMEGKVTHCGFDAFHLARLNGGWKILNLSDTYRQQGCGEAWD